MSNTSNFAFSNVTEGTGVLKPIAIKPVTNYAKTQDEPTEVILTNKTCPLDQGEKVAYRCSDLKRINTTQEVQNPAKVQTGVQYSVRIDEILRTTDAAGAILVDEPIVMNLTIRHPKSRFITADVVNTVLARLLGACYHADGTSRWDDLMRSALAPTVD